MNPDPSQPASYTLIEIAIFITAGEGSLLGQSAASSTSFKLSGPTFSLFPRRPSPDKSF